MWRPCSRLLDAPVTIAGFELLDVVVLVLLPTLGASVLSPFVALGSTLALAALLYWGKRGKPPGAILHGLHNWNVVRLPGLHDPRPTRYTRW